MAGLQTDDAVLAGYAEADRDQYILEKKFGSGSHDHIVSDAASQELDGIHDGLEFPNDEERSTLRRVSDSIPWNAYRMSTSLHVSIGQSPLIIGFSQSLLSSSFASGSPTTARLSSL